MTTFRYRILYAAGSLECGGYKTRTLALEAAYCHAKTCGDQIEVRRVSITEDLTTG